MNIPPHPCGWSIARHRFFCQMRRWIFHPYLQLQPEPDFLRQSAMRKNPNPVCHSRTPQRNHVPIISLRFQHLKRRVCLRHRAQKPDFRQLLVPSAGHHPDRCKIWHLSEISKLPFHLKLPNRLQIPPHLPPPSCRDVLEIWRYRSNHLQSELAIEP